MSNEEGMTLEVENEELITNQAVDQVEADVVRIESSFVGIAKAGQNVNVCDSLGWMIVAGQSVQVVDSLSNVVVAGKDVTNGKGMLVVAGNKAEVVNGVSAVVLTKEAQVEHSNVGVMLAKQITAGENVRVLMTNRQAIIFGAAFGAAAAVVGWLLRRNKR